MKIFYRYFLLLLCICGASKTYAQLPSVTSFTPAKAAIGAVVTITGTNFNTAATSNIVFFGATKAVVSTATATQLVVTVPKGAAYQPISILNTASRLTGYSAVPFIPVFSTHNFH